MYIIVAHILKCREWLYFLPLLSIEYCVYGGGHINLLLIRCGKQDIIRACYLAFQNAVNRENLLHTRLQELESRLGVAIEAAELGWQVSC